MAVFKSIWKTPTDKLKDHFGGPLPDDPAEARKAVSNRKSRLRSEKQKLETAASNLAALQDRPKAARMLNGEDPLHGVQAKVNTYERNVKWLEQEVERAEQHLQDVIERREAARAEAEERRAEIAEAIGDAKAEAQDACEALAERIETLRELHTERKAVNRMDPLYRRSPGGSPHPMDTLMARFEKLQTALESAH